MGVGEVITMANIPASRRGLGSQVWAGRASCGLGNFHWEAEARGQWAPQRRLSRLSRRAGLPRAAPAPGGPPPGARAPAPRFLPATPRPPGEARPAEKLGGVATAATRAAGPGKTKGGCVRPKVRKRGAGGGPAGHSAAFSEPIVRRAHSHTRSARNEHILPPVIKPSTAEGRASLQGEGF